MMVSTSAGMVSAALRMRIEGIRVAYPRWQRIVDEIGRCHLTLLGVLSLQQLADHCPAPVPAPKPVHAAARARATHPVHGAALQPV